MELSKRQKEILDVSIKLIAEKGIQALTIKNIVERIGFSEPALYRHFKSKSDIIMALLKSFQEKSAFVLSDTDNQQMNSIDKIKRFLFDRYERFADDPAATRVMFSEGIFQDNPQYSKKMLNIMHSHAFTMQEIIVKGQQNNEIRNDIPARELFRIIFGAMRLLVNQWCLSDFNFDLILEGKLLWQATEKLLK